MNKDQATAAVARINGLFPPLKQDVSTELIREFLAFDADVVEAATLKHLKDPTLPNGFPVPAKLLQLCREGASNKKLESSTSTDRQLSPPEVYRRQNPKLANCSDYVTIMAVYRDFWFKVSVAESDERAATARKAKNATVIDGRIGSAGYANKFRADCKYALAGAGMELKIAESWAEIIFSDPAHFRRCLDDLRPMQSSREAKASQSSGAMF